jgi:hypothetical protein
VAHDLDCPAPDERAPARVRVEATVRDRTGDDVCVRVVALAEVEFHAI